MNPLLDAVLFASALFIGAPLSVYLLHKVFELIASIVGWRAIVAFFAAVSFESVVYIRLEAIKADYRLAQSTREYSQARNELRESMRGLNEDLDRLIRAQRERLASEGKQKD